MGSKPGTNCSGSKHGTVVATSLRAGCDARARIHNRKNRQTCLRDAALTAPRSYVIAPKGANLLIPEHRHANTCSRNHNVASGINAAKRFVLQGNNLTQRPDQRQTFCPKFASFSTLSRAECVHPLCSTSRLSKSSEVHSRSRY